jgi:hypothetical protein
MKLNPPINKNTVCNSTSLQLLTALLLYHLHNVLVVFTLINSSTLKSNGIRPVLDPCGSESEELIPRKKYCSSNRLCLLGEDLLYSLDPADQPVQTAGLAVLPHAQVGVAPRLRHIRQPAAQSGSRTLISRTGSKESGTTDTEGQNSRDNVVTGMSYGTLLSIRGTSN